MNYKNQLLPELSLKYKTGTEKRVKITSSKDAADFFRSVFDADTIEYNECVVICLLSRAAVTIGWMKVSTGGMAQAIIDPRIIFSTALTAGAHGMIIAHNHPSGNTTPSNHDKKITQQLVEGGKILEVNLLDHVIITKDSYLSFADEGLM